MGPHYIDFYNELHMTNDKDLFLAEPTASTLFLYEGKHIHQFNNQFFKQQKESYFRDVETQVYQAKLASKYRSRIVKQLYE